MGQESDKMATMDVQEANGKEEAEDISRKVSDSQEDIDEDRYRIVITCKRQNRITKTDEVTTEISGDESRHLTVIINNKKYYNSPLPKAASACDYKIEKKKDVDLLYLMITKTESGLWTSKKT